MSRFSALLLTLLLWAGAVQCFVPTRSRSSSSSRGRACLFHRNRIVVGPSRRQKSQHAAAETSTRLDMSTRADFYSILGVSRDTDAREIKRAYRELARKYHPDASGNDTSEIFKEINHAYEVLADPELKKKYDGVERHQFRYAYGYTYSPYQNQNSGEYPACYPNCVVVYLDE